MFNLLLAFLLDVVERQGVHTQLSKTRLPEGFHFLGANGGSHWVLRKEEKVNLIRTQKFVRTKLAEQKFAKKSQKGRKKSTSYEHKNSYG